MKQFLVLLLALLASACVAEKQIKLEDIEKDTLKSAQIAKYEKQLQQYQQYQQYQPQTYDPQTYSQQPQPQYSQYLLPQQYLQQPLFSGNYAGLSANSLQQSYAPPSVPSYAGHPFQAYIGQQLASGGQQIGAPTQAQPIVMAISAPTLAALQHQAYYQAVLPKMLSNLQLYSQGSQQLYSQGSQQLYPQSSQQLYPQGTQQLYYTSQPVQDAPSATQSHPGVVYSPQQYVPSFSPLPPSAPSTKISPAYTQQSQYVSTAPQSFPSAYAAQGAYNPVYPSPSPYTPSQVYSGQDSPSFVAIKPATQQHLLASPSPYIQASTISPLQNKYLNSPQYLAQNYNTIHSSQLSPKTAFTSGVKSTASPPLKLSTAGGYLSSNPNSPYQQYRNIAG